MSSKIKRILIEGSAWVGASLYYVVFAFLVLLLIFVPPVLLGDMIDVVKLDAPRDAIPFSVLFMASFILYLSSRFERLRRVYFWFPVLLPALQMAFIMLVVLDIGLMLFNLWADSALISKGFAILLAVVCLLFGRMFLSYWYLKYPISAKMRR